MTFVITERSFPGLWKYVLVCSKIKHATVSRDNPNSNKQSFNTTRDY